MNEAVAKALVAIGGAIAMAGLVLWLMAKYNLLPGRLPGNFKFEGGGFTVYFPLAIYLIISVVLSILFWIIRKF